MLSKKEFRKLLLDVLEEYRKLEGKTSTGFGRKDHLWALLYKELCLFYDFNPKNDLIQMNLINISVILQNLLPD